MAITIDTQTIIFEPITSGTGTGDSKIITLKTKDTYVPDDIQVTVASTYNVRAGSFSNIPIDGTSYTEDTSSSTVMNENGYLFINKGWFDDTKISLGQLIPDDDDYDNAGVSQIRANFEAYDPDGNKLIGTMPNVTPVFTGGSVTVNKPTVTIPTAPTATISSSGTFLPTNNGGTYGVTTTQPSGTDGTAYLTIDGTISKSDGTARATATGNRAAFNYSAAYAGYINVASGSTPTGGEAPTNNATSSAGTKTIVPTLTDNFDPLYIPIVNLANIGNGSGGLSQGTSSATASFTNPTVTLSHTGKFTELGSSGTGTTYGVTTTQPSGTDGTDFLKITTGGTSNSTAVSGTASISVTRADVVPSSPQQGAINLTKTTTLLGSATETFTTSISGNSISANVSGATSYYIPIVSVSFDGGTVTASDNSSAVTTTPVVGHYMQTPVAKNGSGAALSSEDYGVESVSFSTGDANNYITFKSLASVTTTGVVTAKGKATTTAVTYTNAAGAIAAHSASEAIAADTQTFSKTVNVTPTINNDASHYAKYRIKIVTPTANSSSGSVTVSATANIEQNGITVPVVGVTYSGSMTDSSASDWGIQTTQPNSWADGTSGVCLLVDSSSTEGSVSGTISGTWSRTAVTAAEAYKGAVSIASGATLLAASNNNSFNGTSFNSDPFEATITGGTAAYYIPKVTTSISGGALTGDATITCSKTGNFTCTPSVAFLSRSGSTTGSAISLNTYGITSTAITSGNSVVFNPDGTLDATSRTVSASISVGRAAVTATISKGITKGTTLTSNAVSNTTFNGSESVTASVAAGTDYYVPVVTIPKPSFGTASVTKPKVKMSSTASITGSLPNVPTGVITQATVPTGWTDYITIAPNDESITNGSVSITSSVEVNKGLTAGGTKSENSTTNVSADTEVSKKTFIKIYDESYTVTTA